MTEDIQAPAPPAPGLVRRFINQIEYWVHEVDDEIHSLFEHNKAVPGEVAVAVQAEATSLVEHNKEGIAQVQTTVMTGVAVAGTAITDEAASLVAHNKEAINNGETAVATAVGDAAKAAVTASLPKA